MAFIECPDKETSFLHEKEDFDFEGRGRGSAEKAECDLAGSNGNLFGAKASAESQESSFSGKMKLDDVFKSLVFK